MFSNLPPYVLGGAENQVARLTQAWVRSGHLVEVAGHRIPSTCIFVGDRQVRTHRIRTIEGAGRFGRAAAYLMSTFWLLAWKRTQYDIIYCRGMGDAAISVILAKALGITRLPLIACPINARGKGDTNFIKTVPGWRTIVRLFNRHCNAVNIIAPAITDDLYELGIDIPITASIPNGIPIHPLTDSQSGDEAKRLIFTGRLSPQKGLDLLIPALGRLNGQGYDFRLDIVGDGPLKDELRALIDEQGIRERVRLLGEVATGQIRNMLFQYDAFVLPSRYEGMSNSALEAMEAGIPVLVSRCGGIDRYVDAGKGWICEPGDPASLIEALRLLLETPRDLLAQMGAGARSTVINNFEIGIIAQKNIKLMEMVLGRISVKK